jgi:hypothetical protein
VKNGNFFAENWEKSEKIVIITSTPEKYCGQFTIFGDFRQFSAIFRDVIFVKVANFSAKIFQKIFLHLKNTKTPFCIKPVKIAQSM